MSVLLFSRVPNHTSNKTHTAQHKGPVPVATNNIDHVPLPNKANSNNNSYKARPLPQRISTKQRFRNRHRSSVPSPIDEASTNKVTITSSVESNNICTDISSVTSGINPISLKSSSSVSPCPNTSSITTCNSSVPGVPPLINADIGPSTSDNSGNKNLPSSSPDLLLGDFQKGEIPLHSASLSFSPFSNRGTHPRHRQKRKYTDEDVGEDATNQNTSAKLQKR